MDVAKIDVVKLASNKDCDVQLEFKTIGKLFHVLNAFFEWLMAQRIVLR